MKILKIPVSGMNIRILIFIALLFAPPLGVAEDGVPLRIISEPSLSAADVERQQESTAREKSDLKAQQSMADSTRWIVGLTLLQSVLGIAGALGLFYTLRLTREQIRLNKVSLEVTERAYVIHGGLRYISHPNDEDDGMIWRFHVQWLNVGNTPTRDVSIRTGFYVFDQEVPDDFDFDHHLGDPIRTANLSQNGGAVSSGRYDLAADELAEVRLGHKFLVVYGDCRYRDVFEDTPERVTKFCVKARNITGDPLTRYDAVSNPVDILFIIHDTFVEDT